MVADTITTNGAAIRVVKTGRKLDVGAGAKHDADFETMDISPVHSPNFVHDITQIPWPFEDGTFDEVRCHHVLEHLPSVTYVFHEAWDRTRDGAHIPAFIEPRNTLIDVMNEMHRILKAGGTANIEVPVFPYWTAIADPTHRQFFVPQTFWYFCRGSFQGSSYAEQRELYGVKEWKLSAMSKYGLGEIIRVELTKP